MSYDSQVIVRRKVVYLPQDVMEVLWRVQPEYLAAAYEEAEDRFGSIDDYLAEGLGLGEAQRERLKALYLGG